MKDFDEIKKLKIRIKKELGFISELFESEGKHLLKLQDIDLNEYRQICDCCTYFKNGNTRKNGWIWETYFYERDGEVTIKLNREYYM